MTRSFEDSDAIHYTTRPIKFNLQLLQLKFEVQHYSFLLKKYNRFILETPLFRVRDKSNTIYCYNDDEKKEAIESIGKVNEITRFKGLGEMNPSQLRETTMAADTRRLVQLTVSLNDKVDQLMDMLLAKKRASDRREWLRDKGNLADV